MLSTTSEYALRAVIFLVQNEDDWPITGERIADRTGISVKYLSKILSDLTRQGILDSTRGKRGGYWFAVPPKDVALFDVVQLFERFDTRRCPFGNGRCGDTNPCAAHDAWAQVILAQQDFLQGTSVHDVAISKKHRRGPRKKKRRAQR